jgi:hypothetical protein
MRFRLISAALLVPILLLSACKPNNPNADAKGGPAGQTTGTVTFPASFPSYIPVYPSAQPFNNPAVGLANSMLKNMVGGGVSMASFLTSDTPDKVLAFYKGAFEKAGLTADDVKAKAGVQMIAYNRPAPDVESVMVTISKMPPDKAIVQIVYIKAPPEPKN